MSMYSIDSNQEDLEVSSHQSPTLIKAQILEKQESTLAFVSVDCTSLQDRKLQTG